MGGRTLRVNCTGCVKEGQEPKQHDHTKCGLCGRISTFCPCGFCLAKLKRDEIKLPETNKIKKVVQATFRK